MLFYHFVMWYTLYVHLQNPFIHCNFLKLGDKFIICSTKFMLWCVKVIKNGGKTLMYCGKNVTWNGKSFIWCHNFIVCRCLVIILYDRLVIWSGNFFMCSRYSLWWGLKQVLAVKFYNGEEVQFYFGKKRARSLLQCTFPGKLVLPIIKFLADNIIPVWDFKDFVNFKGQFCPLNSSFTTVYRNLKGFKKISIDFTLHHSPLTISNHF